MSTAIEFNHVSKQYRLGLVSTKTLSHDLQRWWTMNVLRKEDPYLKIGETNDRAVKGASDYVWALKDIDFKVEQGDVVGIIGKNGAGKSTLLKLLSKVTGPTTGSIRARGRIGSLLEVGTGFHQEMTGRENIYMNGAIMGMNKSEISKKLDAIIDFSGCERYIDTPVKRYSSGMTVRLGFAVAAFMEPEILVVDEVLAVGDAEFQKKAIGKMQDVSKGEGRTVLFVSHNMGSMQQLCKRGILLDKGGLVYDGDILSTISKYQTETANRGNYICNTQHPDWKMQLLEASISCKESENITTASQIDIKMKIRVNKRPNRPVIGFNLYSAYGYPIARSDFNEKNGQNQINEGTYEISFIVPPYMLATGTYKLVFDVAEADVTNYATDETTITFDVTLDDSHTGNIFNEAMPLKCSIMQPLYFSDIERI